MIDPTRKPPCDWEGCAIPADEPEDAVIRVWEIEPSTDCGYDSMVVRDYWQAVDAARDVVAQRMDEHDPDDPDAEVVVKVKIVKMRKDDYEAIQESEP